MPLKKLGPKIAEPRALDLPCVVKRLLGEIDGIGTMLGGFTRAFTYFQAHKGEVDRCLCFVGTGLPAWLRDRWGGLKL